MTFILFDPNNSEDASRQKIEEFYGEFSDSVRAKLLARRIVRPSNVYDILYPQTRETLLSKNNSNILQNLDKTSESFRNFLLARNKNIQKNDLLSFSEDIRKSLQARNKIIDSREDLLSKSESIRKNLLSKHKNIDEEDLASKNEKYRQDLLSKNRTRKLSDLSESSKDLRDSQLSKNISKEHDLLNDSDLYRDNLKSKNKANAFSNLIFDSETFRKNLLSKNKKDASIGESNIERDSVQTRRALLSKNKQEDVVDLVDLFESIRDTLKSRNVSKNISLEKISEAFREVLISKNKENITSLEDISSIFRKNLLTKNKSEEEDLLSLSEDTRKALLSKNKNIGINIDELYTETRKSLLSKNKNIKDADLVDLFETARENLLSKNKSTSKPIDQTPFRENLVSRNKAKQTDLLASSDATRKDLIGKNKTKQTDLLASSDSIRKDALAKNKANVTDLNKSSSSIRDGLLSRNVIVVTDLLEISTSFRSSLTSRNKGKISDLLNDSSNFRKDILSKNKANVTDLQIISKPFRTDLLSRNKAKNTDLEKISTPFRVDLLSKNVNKITDLEKISLPFRKDLLSKNVNKITDLEKISVPFRNGLLAKNVDKITDLEKISLPFRNDLIAKNIQKNTDLAVISLPFYKGLISKNISKKHDLLDESENFRKDLVAKNIESTSDLLFDSSGSRANNISKNIGLNHVPLIDASKKFRNDLLSKNKEIINGESLLALSNQYRNDLLAKNVGFGLFGINLEAAGTSAFLGVSRVLVQGTLYKNLLLSRNKTKKQSPYTDIHGKQQQFIFNLTLDNQGFSIDARNDAAFQNTIISRHSVGLASVFGNGTNNGKYYGNQPELRAKSIKQGSVTDAARIYNLQKNAYNLEGQQPFASTGYNNLQNLAASSFNGLNDLIQTTIGGLTSNEGKSLGTPTTPNSIIQSSEGKYYGTNNPEAILNPVKSTNTDDAGNLVAKSTLPINPFDNDDFRTGKRGVRRIVKLIKDSTLPFAQNFDVQNSTTYRIGTKADGSPKIQRQRFTIANPYSPGTAQKLSLYFKNYANNQGMFFPPYVVSFGHQSTANWNETNFLGRPEPIYTYNNSKRSGSITFFILTDYSQSVDIGYDFPDQGPVTVATETFPRHFTDGNLDTKTTIANLKSTIANKVTDLTALKQKKAEAQDSGETAELDEQIKNAQQDITNSNTRVWELETAIETSYFESSQFTKNVYAGINVKSTKDGYVELNTQNTKERLDDMKSKLQFQPGFFSGDKVDFVRRVEFLEKMTRPSKNDGPGFSFIKPPVCHMHLGDWFNHDIIVHSINYNYADVPWTLDGNGRVQPMWVSVDISFDIVGIYRHVAGPALSADDNGGYFSDLVK